MSNAVNNNQAAKVHAQVLQAIQAPKESKGAQKAAKSETKCGHIAKQKELPEHAKGKKIKKVSQSDSSVQKPTVSKTDKVAKSVVNNITINNTTNITNNITVRKSGSDKKFDKLMKAFEGLMKAFAKQSRPQVNIFFVGKPKHAITAFYLPRYNKPAFHFHQSGLGLLFNKRG